MEENRRIYNSQLAVNTYYKRTGLTPGEFSILNQVVKDNKEIKMLDIGIGCGRTYEGFRKYVAEYIGIDYSEAMIKVCKEKFELDKDCFFLSDARNLSGLYENVFDFILFSFNGIDCVNETDRVQIFKEVKRVAKNKAMLAFSSHNLFNVTKLFKFRIPKNPFNYLPEYKQHKFIKNANPAIETILKREISVIKDGDLNKETEYCYVKPDFQIDQLKSLGFDVVEIFSDQRNFTYPLTTDWKNITEPWLYYLCQINK